VRRTVATLLVVASPVLMAVPVGARETRVVGPTVVPAAPAPVQAVAMVPAAPATLAPPAVPVPAPATAAVRPAVRAVRAKAPAPALSDAAYAAQLQADLCRARAIFCGLDRGGRYPAG
jgi:hypothetical protein